MLIETLARGAKEAEQLHAVGARGAAGPNLGADRMSEEHHRLAGVQEVRLVLGGALQKGGVVRQSQRRSQVVEPRLGDPLAPARGKGTRVSTSPVCLHVLAQRRHGVRERRMPAPEIVEVVVGDVRPFH
jgi:hypothetical protein